MALPFVLLARADGPLAASTLALILLCHLCEGVFVVYAFCFAAAAIRYLRLGPAEPAALAPAPERYPPVAVIYLCCGDVDPEALESLSRLRYPGRLLYVVHDDSPDPADRRVVDGLAARMQQRFGAAWRVLRRSEHGGGKPGALNFVLERTRGEHELFLIADNDSAAPDPDVLTKSLGSFAHPDVAIVQLRNGSRTAPEDGAFASTLARAVDIFDAFMSGLFVRLWTPFVGHNAVLRTAAVEEAGGFTPGVFADDVDLTARLTLLGRRVVYRRDLYMAETHPASYRAFCARSRKWAHGCAQVIRMHLAAILRSRRVPLRAKFGFLLFTGFYTAQVAMLLYMLVILFVFPALLGRSWSASWWALALGTAIPLAPFLPVVAYLGKQGRRLPLLRTLVACALTYGSMDFWTCAGLFRGMRRGETAWIPTNRAARGGRGWLEWAHFAVGSSFLLVPLWLQPQLLLFPLTWLFAAKYLFVPTVAAHYVPQEPPPRSSLAVLEPVRGVATKLLVLGLSAGVLLPSAPARAQADVQTRNGRLEVGGEPFRVRGIHYSPWRAGTGPGRGFDYPDALAVGRDLDDVASLHANTILVYDPPEYVLDLARERDLRVIYTFNVFWWKLASEGEEALAEISAELEERVEQLHEHDAVLAWMVGNEVPAWVIDELSADGVRDALSRMRERIRSVDPDHPVCHGNWPQNRNLDIDRDMDMLCYNVYPFYPTEVAVTGYEDFLRDEIMPLAGGRPVVITEFGVNTIEASPGEQARVLQRCWDGILAVGADGGVVFAFADEWWKNYDGPIRPPDWWRRREDPDDHLTHDADPEEHYGILTHDREPKPAFRTVRRMFLEAERGPVGSALIRLLFWAGGAAALAMVVLAAWLPYRARSRHRRESGAPSASTAVLLALLPLPLCVPAPSGAETLGPAATVELLGAAPGDNAGASVASVGDVDGDGFADVAVGAPFADPGVGAGGSVLVFRGGPELFAEPSVPAEQAEVLSGTTADEQFGISVAGEGDLDGDGIADLAVGARFNDLAATDAGAVFVHFGGADLGAAAPLVLLAEASDDWFGQSTAHAGDVNGDGYADLVVGAPYNDAVANAAGRAYVYLGGAAMDAVADVILEGAAQSNSHFGWSVGGGSDVNGDGFSDVVVGARMHGTGALGAAGRVYVFYGGDPMDAIPDLLLEGEAKDDWFGEAVAGLGDVDGDGYGDLGVGAIFADPASGSAAGKGYVFLGGASPDASADLVVAGPHADAQLGNAVAGWGPPGGFADVLFGVHFADAPTGTAVGEAWLLRGGVAPDAAVDLVLRGDASHDQAGEAVSVGPMPAASAPAVGYLAGVHFSDSAGLDAGKALPEPGVAALAAGALLLAGLARSRS